MKVAIYIEDGVTQLVLTPESDWEKDVTAKMLPDGDHELKLHRGSFYECRGGWTRHRERYGLSAYGVDESRDDSLILRVEPARPLHPESVTHE